MEFFKLDWGELAKCSLPSLAVILRFNPGDDGEVEFLSRAPVLTIKHVLLQECEEALHGGVVARGSNSTHGPNKQVLLPPVEPSQFTSIRYGERLDEIGARPSIGSIGDSFDNALAESVNALYKTELTRGPGRGPWRTIDDLELQTLGWVHWHNNERLHSYLGDLPPVEFEAIYDATISETSLMELTS